MNFKYRDRKRVSLVGRKAEKVSIYEKVNCVEKTERLRVLDRRRGVTRRCFLSSERYKSSPSPIMKSFFSLCDGSLK